MTEPEFERLMQTIADGWNEGNARKAADCFSEDVIYSEPPEKQLYRGRDELYEFFGGDRHRYSHENDLASSGVQQAGTDWLRRIHL
jgi:hypothetical protein